MVSRVSSTPPLMDAHKIAAHAGGGWPPDRIFCFREVASTNALAAKALEERGAAADRTVITAESQSEGRGRFGRRWFDVPGRGIALSVALYVPTGLPLQSLALLPLAGALAVMDALEEIGLHCALKWPNDVLIRGRKTAGTMAEVRWRMEQPMGAVLGIGINLNHEARELPGEIAKTATSVFMETGEKVERERVAGLLLSLLGPLLKTAFDDPATLTSMASSRWVHSPGEKIEVLAGSERKRGAFAGIDGDGALLLEEEDGITTIRYGDIGNLRRL